METSMSYRTRQRKRAIRAAKAKNRKVIAGRWYLTIVKRKTCCARCAGILKIGDVMVYRHTPREARCKQCAESDPDVKARPSTRWEAETRRARA